MTQLLLFNVTNGLIIGAFYVLMALGLSLILNLSGVINFAHGGFLAIGAYLAFTLMPYIGFWGGLLVAPVLTAIIVGGLGSLPGTLLGGLLIGVASGLATVFVPSASEAVIYVMMALVLLVRPRGLLGEEGRVQ